MPDETLYIPTTSALNIFFIQPLQLQATFLPCKHRICMLYSDNSAVSLLAMVHGLTSATSIKKRLLIWDVTTSFKPRPIGLSDRQITEYVWAAEITKTSTKALPFRVRRKFGLMISVRMSLSHDNDFCIIARRINLA